MKGWVRPTSRDTEFDDIVEEYSGTAMGQAGPRVDGDP